MEGRKVLDMGLRWNITGPSFLNVWEDPRIPTMLAFKLSSQRPLDNPIIYISDIIDANTNQWIQPLLHANFSPFECAQIFKIPLGQMHKEAELVWHFNSSGIFFVKSAYYLLKQDQLREQS